MTIYYYIDNHITRSDTARPSAPYVLTTKLPHLSSSKSIWLSIWSNATVRTFALWWTETAAAVRNAAAAFPAVTLWLNTLRNTHRKLLLSAMYAERGKRLIS